MKSPVAIVLGGIGLILVTLPFLSPSSSAPGKTSETPSSTKPAVTQELFASDRRQPYRIALQEDGDTNPMRWELVVDEQVMGVASIGERLYDVYGSVVTSTDQLVFAAYNGTGEAVAQATTTWDGQRFSTEAVRAATSRTLMQGTTSSSVPIRFQRASGRWEDASRSLGCEYVLTLPVIELGGKIEKAAATRMNATLRSALLGTRSTPEQAQGAYLRECRTELESELEALGDAEVGGSMMQRSWDSRVSAVVEYGRWISMLVQTYTYTGGAHGSTVVQSFVFDTQTGEEQELRNMVRDDRALATLHGQIASRLLSEYTDGLFEDQAALLRAYVANRAEQPALLARGELGYATSTTFLLGPTGLRVFFQQYEVAPYAAGMPTVDLPFAAWQALAIDELRP